MAWLRWCVMVFAVYGLGAAPVVYSAQEFRMVNCQECGEMLVGGCLIEYETLQWVETSGALTVQMSARSTGDNAETMNYGLTGEALYVNEQESATVTTSSGNQTVDFTGQWLFDALTTYTIQPRFGQASPPLSMYFCPGSAPNGTADLMGEVRGFAIKNDYTNVNPTPRQVLGTAIADDPNQPALTLKVEVNGDSIAGYSRVDDVLVVPLQRAVQFIITPLFNAAKSPTVKSVPHVMVDLFAEEKGTSCVNEPTFSTVPLTRNNFQPATWFQYLYEKNSRSTPNSCKYKVSFLATVNQPIELYTIANADSSGGYAQYTFAIRGHADLAENDQLAGNSQYPGRHCTYALQTQQPDCTTQTCSYNNQCSGEIVPGPNCDEKQYDYKVNLDQAGFYVAEASLVEGASEGFWGGSYRTSKGVNVGGFNMGATLKENGEQPGFMAFYLSGEESVAITPFEYTGGVGTFRLKLSSQDEFGNRNTIFGPVDTISGQLHTTQSLASGFYVSEVMSNANTARGQFGIQLNANTMVGGVNVGGWLDSGGTGFAGLYVAEPQEAEFTLLCGDTYGDTGSGRMDLKVYRQDGESRIQVYP